MKLDYQTPPVSTKPPAKPRDTLIKAMAVAWILNAAVSGISGDRVTIPLAKKIAISATAVIIISLLCTIRGAWRWVVLFTLFSISTVGVMWFWN
jgi:hypothetical protein